MKAMLNILVIAIILSMPVVVSATDEYFYCGYTNMDGTGQSYGKFGKGTDFKYNKNNQRWEWINKYEIRFIYPNGKYELKPLVSFLDEKTGKCNAEMEKIYKNKMEEIINKYK
jgi:hypothetical protein